MYKPRRSVTYWDNIAALDDGPSENKAGCYRCRWVVHFLILRRQFRNHCGRRWLIEALHNRRNGGEGAFDQLDVRIHLSGDWYSIDWLLGWSNSWLNLALFGIRTNDGCCCWRESSIQFFWEIHHGVDRLDEAIGRLSSPSGRCHWLMVNWYNFEFPS